MGGDWSQMANWKPAWIRVFCHSFRALTGKPHMKIFFFEVRRKLVLDETMPVKQNIILNHVPRPLPPGKGGHLAK